MSVDWSSLILILSPITVYEPPNWLQPENPCNLPVSKTAVISIPESEALSSSETTSQDVPSKESDTGPPTPWQPASTNTANSSAATDRTHRRLMVPSLLQAYINDDADLEHVPGPRENILPNHSLERTRPARRDTLKASWPGTCSRSASSLMYA